MYKMYRLGYVASPLNAPTDRGIRRNMKKARAYELALNQLTGERNRAVQGYVPALLNDNIPEEREVGLEIGLELLNKSDAIILCGLRLSKGMAIELRKAVSTGKRVFVLKGIPCRSRIINLFMIKAGKLRIEERTKTEADTILYRREII